MSQTKAYGASWNYCAASVCAGFSVWRSASSRNGINFSNWESDANGDQATWLIPAIVIGAPMLLLMLDWSWKQANEPAVSKSASIAARGATINARPVFSIPPKTAKRRWKGGSPNGLLLPERNWITISSDAQLLSPSDKYEPSKTAIRARIRDVLRVPP